MAEVICQMQTAMTMLKSLQKFGWILVSGFLLASCFAPEKTVTKDYEETFTDIKEIELDGRFLEVTYEGRSGDGKFISTPISKLLKAVVWKSGTANQAPNSR